MKLRDGLQVVAFGSVGVYEPRGQYQLNVKTLVDDGVGALQREYEALKRRLSDEGLFDAARKKPIPQMPATVGFVTSPTGAAAQDFMRILIRRGWRGRVVVLPAKVQGEGAAAEMVEMLGLAETLGIFDLIVIGRGGGSIEDLWAFNEEPLVRAVASCPMPTISAVGHEIDFTLCDFAADMRAETPSGGRRAHLQRIRPSCETDRVCGPGDRLRHRGSRGPGPRARRPRALPPAASFARGPWSSAGYLRLDDMSNRLASALRSSRAAAPPAAFRRRVAARPRAPGDAGADRVAAAPLALEAPAAGRAPAPCSTGASRSCATRRAGPSPGGPGSSPGQRLEAEFADGRAPLRAERG